MIEVNYYASKRKENKELFNLLRANGYTVTIFERNDYGGFQIHAELINMSDADYKYPEFGFNDKSYKIIREKTQQFIKEKQHLRI